MQLQESPASKFFLPHAPNTFQFSAPRAPALPPPPQTQITISIEREREFLDRRKNWVFMTPEEMMGTDSQKDGLLEDKYDKDGQEKKSTTVMERYYQRLYDADQQKTTNQVDKFDPDTWTKANNSFLTGDSQAGGDTPNSSGGMGVFQPARSQIFPDVFGTDKSATALTPEQVRAKAEQDAHMESFKQLWDIDQQPAKAPMTATVAPVVQPSSTSVFGSQSSQPYSPVSVSPIDTGFSQVVTPTQPSTITSLRSHSSPPHASFAPVSSPF